MLGQSRPPLPAAEMHMVAGVSLPGTPAAVAAVAAVAAAAVAAEVAGADGSDSDDGQPGGPAAAHGTDRPPAKGRGPGATDALAFALLTKSSRKTRRLVSPSFARQTQPAVRQLGREGPAAGGGGGGLRRSERA